jgi:tetratricopeptide (TPR) repeat protein
LEYLDLSRHHPHELQGKAVRIEGCAYTVGTVFRTSEQGHAHHLCNDRSGLLLHVIQLRQSYLEHPDVARSASQTKARLTAELRSSQLAEGKAAIVCSLRVIDIGTGAFELHEFPGPMDPQSASTFKQASRLLTEGDHDAAIRCIGGLVEREPCHTEALACLASCHAQAGDFRSAMAAIAAALAAESNLTAYWVQQMEYQLSAGLPVAAAASLNEFQRRFPLEHDCDYWGVHALLRAGQTEAAGALLERAALSATDRAHLAAFITPALAAAAAVAKAKGTDPAGRPPSQTLDHQATASKSADRISRDSRPWWKRWRRS